MHFSIAVVDVDGEGCWIWHVNGNHRSGVATNRLTGAWGLRIDETEQLASLTCSRFTVTTDRARLSPWTDFIRRHAELSVELLHARLTNRIEVLQRAFAVEQDSRSKSMKLTPPTWPIPPALGVGLGLVRMPIDDDQVLHDRRRCLALAQWLSALLQSWEDVEEERLARPLLRRAFGEDPQEMLALVGGVK